LIPKGDFLFAYGGVAVANRDFTNVYGRSRDAHPRASGGAGPIQFFYLSNKTNDVGDQILTGVVDGVAMSVQQRMFRLYNYWVPYCGSVAASAGLLAFAQLQFAGQARDDGIRILAYLAALFGAAGAIGWLILGASAFNHYRSILRQAS
jgi:hypothetical protein